MKDERDDLDEQLSEEIFDALLRHALIEDMQREMDELEQDEDLWKPYPFSKRFDRRMEKFFRKEVYHTPSPAVRILRKVAIWAVCLLAAGCVAMMAIPSVRASIQSLFMEVFDDHISFSRKADVSADIPAEPYAEFDGYTINYLPEGYEVEEWDERTGRYTAVFLDANDQKTRIKFFAKSKNLQNGETLIDNDHISSNYQDVNGLEGYKFESFDDIGINKIIWVDDNYYFDLSGSCSIDELLTIAQNITVKN